MSHQVGEEIGDVLQSAEGTLRCPQQTSAVSLPAIRRAGISALTSQSIRQMKLPGGYISIRGRYISVGESPADRMKNTAPLARTPIPRPMSAHIDPSGT